MAIIKQGKNPFKPKARLLVLLGEQLITNEIIAVVELVKNAYDADSTKSRVTLNGVKKERGNIIIEDDGVGMNLDTILNVWFEPATDFRKKQRDKRERTKKFDRFPLGEKGIGRFAGHKLGNVVEVITKHEKSNEEIVLTVDWNLFEKDEYLERVPISWATRNPEVFTGDRNGTKITIRDLRKKWTVNMVRNLYIKLQTLNSPFMKKTDFKVEIDAPEFKEIVEKLPEISEILDKSIYKLEGKVDENGILDFNYEFDNEAHPGLKRKIENTPTEDAKDPKKFKDKRKPLCGRFSVKFYVWDLDPATLGETIQRSYYTKFVRPHTGIRIYRDGFRVWPYGESDDDSFGLDLRRVNFPTQRLSRNQVIGIIEISSTENPELRDKTDREGLILNDEYEDFRDLVIGCLSVLEAEKRRDKNKVDALREKKKPEDEVTLAVDEMRSHMRKKGHLETYKEDVDRIESTYRQKVKDIIEPLYVSAGLGIAYTLPVHEIIRNIDDIEKIMNTLLEDMKKSGAREAVLNDLKKILRTTNIVDDLVRGVGKLIRKGRAEEVSLRLMVNDAIDIMKMRLEREKVDVKIQEKEKMKMKVVKNLVVTAILNLLDNSLYWLLRNEKDRKIIIRIDSDLDGRPRILVSDNGPGIKDEPSLLVQPFFTRKPDGSGLGLYIVDRIMKAHKGEMKFLRKGEEKELLSGANVALSFPKDTGR